MYLRGVRYTFSLCVNVSDDYRMSDLTLGNVFWPCPQAYDSTISRLSARFENSDSSMKILSRRHPLYIYIYIYISYRKCLLWVFRFSMHVYRTNRYIFSGNSDNKCCFGSLWHGVTDRCILTPQFWRQSEAWVSAIIPSSLLLVLTWNKHELTRAGTINRCRIDSWIYSEIFRMHRDSSGIDSEFRF